MNEARVPAVLDAITSRTEQVIRALDGRPDSELRGPSLLPGWDRLTIACHLRYGAEALRSMTEATIAGERTSYYPQGRDQQRPATLRPRSGEDAADVLESLSRLSQALDETWHRLTEPDWRSMVREPDDRVDLGALPLARLPMLRLTEVEVHGTDLDLGLPDWSPVFVNAALPFRIAWLNTRRANHRQFDNGLTGSWLLSATDGPSYRVIVDGGTVDAHPIDGDTHADAIIDATSRDLLALVLGRRTLETVTYHGDRALAAAFGRAFPGP